MFGLSSIEKRISAKIDGLEEKMEAYFSDRFEKIEEHLQQSIRQERRNQAALESVFENQKAELSMLRRIRDESGALKVLMNFAEGFALWRQSQPDAPEIRVLWMKLGAMLDHFGLTIEAEAWIPFDPSLHEACAVRFDPEAPDGHVLEVVRPGFSSDGEVLRYAAVVVNRPNVLVLGEDESESGYRYDDGASAETEGWGS
ncbi:MAG: nucleotide exchange factor GrpE [Synergistaceae bacterium]|jgi:molecular chaperone GrpE (heat shock protein)|nr:nucleotide exchange factor GrpE [Synergistaceae bacterium]